MEAPLSVRVDRMMRKQTLPAWVSGGAPRFLVSDTLEEDAEKAPIKVQFLGLPTLRA